MLYSTGLENIKNIPVPKSNSINEMNDLRPIDLSLVPFKCQEKLILTHVLPI